MKKGNSDMNFIQEVLYIFIYRNTISKNPTKKIPLAKNHTIFICFCYAIVVFLLLVCVLSMHAPWEVTSKSDIYEAYRGYIAFLQNA